MNAENSTQELYTKKCDDLLGLINPKIFQDNYYNLGLRTDGTSHNKAGFDVLADLCPINQLRVFLEARKFGNFPYRTLPPEACFSFSIEKENKLKEEDYNADCYQTSSLPDNSKSNAVMRLKAEKFILESDFNTIETFMNNTCWLNNVNRIYSYQKVFYLVYFLTCMRNVILTEDFKRRQISYNPLYQFDNEIPFSFNNTKDYNLEHSEDIVYLATFASFFSDIYTDLFSTYVYKNSPASSYFINTLEEDELNKFPGISWTLSKDCNYILNQTLVAIWRNLIQFDALLRRISVDQTALNLASSTITRLQIKGKTSIIRVRLLKMIFTKIASLESYVRSF